MSLQVDSGRRGRSRSPGRRVDDGDRSRSPAPPPNVVTSTREPSYAYPEDDLDDRYAPSSNRRGGGGGGGMPYPDEGDDGGVMPGGRYDYDDRRKSSSAAAAAAAANYRTVSPPSDAPYRSSRDKVSDYKSSRDKVDDYRGSRDKVDDYRSSRDRFDDDPRVRTVEPRGGGGSGGGGRRDEEADSRYDRKKDRSGADDDKFSFLPQKYSTKTTTRETEKVEIRTAEPRRGGGDRDRDRDGGRKSKYDHDDDEDELAYGRRPSPPSRGGAGRHEDEEDYKYSRTRTEYDRDGDKVKMSSREYEIRTASPSRKPSIRDRSPGPQYTSDSRRGGREPEDPRRSSSNVLTVGGPERRGGDIRRDRSPHRSSLSVNTPHHSATMSLSVANAPASPLLESYHGTYQDMSPMPSPLLLASHHPESSSMYALEPLSPQPSDDERGGEKMKRRARFHDPEDIASRLARALKGDHRPPDTEPLIEILPGLTHEQVMELRAEYKRLVKTGADRKGVNVAKHIRARLKDEDPNLMKACYAVALGRWESEAYWANFWYQGDKTRRELLIEALMGRSNDEIRRIKDGFSDKKYDNSLTKCMKTELKEDKFKKAVLLVLEERRMDEFDEDGRLLPIDGRRVEDDAEDLRGAVKAEKGGESLMISIVVQRSDAHLREVLKVYEKRYRSNFARDALKKSGNLVGELLAHILNGVINKPVRDALLLHHALTATKKDGLRRELLTSRLVRYHWDRRHMEAVKRAYREKYGRDLQDAVREATSGRWGQFCRELCITRMPDHVKTVERIEVIKSSRDSHHRRDD